MLQLHTQPVSKYFCVTTAHTANIKQWTQASEWLNKIVNKANAVTGGSSGEYWLVVVTSGNWWWLVVVRCELSAECCYSIRATAWKRLLTRLMRLTPVTESAEGHGSQLITSLAYQRHSLMKLIQIHRTNLYTHLPHHYYLHNRMYTYIIKYV